MAELLPRMVVHVRLAAVSSNIMLTIIDRYIWRETVQALLAFLLVLVLVLSGHIFIRFLESVVSGDLGSAVLFKFLGIEILKQFPRLIPPAFFFSILFALGRMYRDSEMVALASCGVGTGRIYRSFLITAVLLTLVEAWLSLYVMPWASRTAAEIRFEQKQRVDLTGIEVGRFNEYSRGDLVVYVEGISKDGKTMTDIFVQKRDQDVVGLITADRGYQHVDRDSGGRYLVLEDGYRYRGVIGARDFSVGRFERYAVRVQQPRENLHRLRHRAKPTSQLWNSKKMVDKAEFQFRLSLPLAVMVFTVLSIPLSRSLPRQGMFERLLVAFVLYFIFINLQDVSESWMEDGVTPAWAGMWWVHLLLLLVGLGLNIPDMTWYRALRLRGLKGLRG